MEIIVQLKHVYCPREHSRYSENMKQSMLPNIYCDIQHSIVLYESFKALTGCRLFHTQCPHLSKQLCLHVYPDKPEHNILDFRQTTPQFQGYTNTFYRRQSCFAANKYGLHLMPFEPDLQALNISLTDFMNWMLLSSKFLHHWYCHSKQHRFSLIACTIDVIKNEDINKMRIYCLTSTAIIF